MTVPTFDFASGTLSIGDCLDVMADIPDGSIDMILCDLPYGTTACSWDEVIPFEPLWAHYWRVVNPNAAVVLTAAQPFTSALVMSQANRFKYSWIWEKSRASGFAHAKNAPLKKHEDICVFSKGAVAHVGRSEKRVSYNPQGLIHDPRRVSNTQSRGAEESAFGNRPSHETEYLQEFTNYPTSVLQIPSVTRASHPTQKPVALFEYLIRTYTNEGDTVLDNCSGSGTTAMAAINSGRRFICIERDLDYALASADRISKVCPQ